ncbi:PTS sugar transporter subunit IIA [Enterococcus saccharolyticus]|uniref:PTS beta-glucoside transporter subunit IIA n=1 Tax=Candidatus Enterococcus willemsii TaxID=1857215 RepID=A0ABQ6Z1J3_9ENTE|nr:MULTISPECIES: PTS sugar transporter subunit IIA [Enterococcus]KAF1304529.1 PTS beta-glucoside transporter subunit IIA [Enterococcus sp. CU12B]MCD5001261.1 PTS sugar transporter subunit IIA [Enterococcus saccharolyticus]
MGNTIGVLIMTHGDFGKAAIESAELIVGKQDNYDTMSVFVVDQVDDLKQEMLDKADKLDTSKGLLVLTDIVGGTPINLASYLLERENTIVASGVNLPVLLEVLMSRTGTIEELAEVVQAAYNQGLTIRTNEDLEGDEEDEYSL